MNDDFAPEVRSINVFQKIKVDRKVAAERYQREIDEMYSLSADGDTE
jgi:long-subunit acyl-CoA synthetase (AMP-forming)